VEHRQAGLQGDGEQHVVADDEAVGAVHCLSARNSSAIGAAGAIFGRQEGEEGQGLFDLLPGSGATCMRRRRVGGASGGRRRT
jgi:hypothetical protein